MPLAKQTALLILTSLQKPGSAYLSFDVTVFGRVGKTSGGRKDACLVFFGVGVGGNFGQHEDKSRCCLKENVIVY